MTTTLRRTLSCILLTATLALPCIPALAAEKPESRIAAVVNADVISTSDLEERARLVIASSGMPDTPELRAKLVPQLLSGLVDEAIRMQEAKRLNIDVSEAEIEKGFADIAGQNNMKPEQFKEVLRRHGIKVATLYRQIESQLAWTGVIMQKIRPQVDVSEADVETLRTQMQTQIGKTEYRLAEITLPVDKASREAEVRQLAGRLIAEIREGKAPFPKLARQFSQSASAAQGGDIGWVQEGQLADELDAEIRKMEKNQLAGPIRTTGAFVILFMIDRRQMTAETLPSEQELRNRIGLERLDRLQRRYLLDLKSAAFIDTRS